MNWDAVTAVAFGIVLAVVFGRTSPTSINDKVNLRTVTRQPIVKVTTRSSEPIKVLLCEITAYSPTVEECDASPLVTASGKRVRVGGIAADLRVLPFGSVVIIPNYNNGNPCTVIDTGSAIRGNKLDVFFWSTDEAIHWGRRKNVPVQVLYIPK
jgi:3D (Asp-Asp-Asp) domain-containing protein